MTHSEKIYEKAPPSPEAEEWILKNKEKFKSEYGAKGEQILYATAWKLFGDGLIEETEENYTKDNPEHVKIIKTKTGEYYIYSGKKVWSWKENTWHGVKDVKDSDEWKSIYHWDKGKLKKTYRDSFKHREKPITEHDAGTDYVEKWRDRGFEIKVEQSTEGGQHFTVVKQGSSFDIHEPRDGVYHFEDGTYESFDDAMDAAINSSFPDRHVTENHEEETLEESSLDRILRLAGL